MAEDRDQLYHYIRVWYTFFGYPFWRINEVIARAKRDNAPANAIYPKTSEWQIVSNWQTIDDCADSDFKARVIARVQLFNG